MCSVGVRALIAYFSFVVVFCGSGGSLGRAVVKMRGGQYGVGGTWPSFLVLRHCSVWRSVLLFATYVPRRRHRRRKRRYHACPRPVSVNGVVSLRAVGGPLVAFGRSAARRVLRANASVAHGARCARDHAKDIAKDGVRNRRTARGTGRRASARARGGRERNVRPRVRSQGG